MSWKRAAVVVALVVAGGFPAPAAAAGDDSLVTGPPVPLAMAPMIATAPCQPGGPTAADGAVANQVRPQLNGPRMGSAVNAYRISCARAIVDTIRGRNLASRAAVIAVTTAITESTLNNYTEAVDHDSLGLYQQRPSTGWGTPAQITDPVFATNSFINAMLRKFPNNGWMTGDIGRICQAVQVSAFPDAYNPEVHDAQIIVNALWASNAPLPVQVLATTGDGGLFHTIRQVNGAWSGGFGNVEAEAGPIDDIATDAARTGNDMQVVAVTRTGQLYHTARLANGDWLSWGNVLSATGATFQVVDVAAASVDNELHVLAVTTAGNVFHAIRHVDGSWTSFGNVNSVAGNPGQAVKVSAAGVRSVGGAVTDLHVVVATSDGKLWHTARKADGAWLSFANVQGQTGDRGPVADVSAAGIGVDLHVVAATGDGKIWHTIRKGDGSWLPFGDVVAAAQSTLTGATAVDAVGEPNGDLHLLIAAASGGVFHTARKTDGAWLTIGDVKTQTSNPGTVTNIAGA